VRALLTLLTNYYSDEEFKNSVVVGTCSMYSGEKCIQDFGREMRTLEYLSAGGTVIYNGSSRFGVRGPCIGLIWLRIRTGGGLL